MATQTLPSADGYVASRRSITTTMPDNAIALDVSAADAEFPFPVHIWVGGAGNVKVVPANAVSGNVTITMPAGMPIPFRVRAVISSGTTATALIAVY